MKALENTRPPWLETRDIQIVKPWIDYPIRHAAFPGLESIRTLGTNGAFLVFISIAINIELGGIIKSRKRLSEDGAKNMDFPLDIMTARYNGVVPPKLEVQLSQFSFSERQNAIAFGWMSGSIDLVARQLRKGSTV